MSECLVPSGVNSPLLLAFADDSGQRVRLSWSPPSSPNGTLTSFQIIRDGLVLITLPAILLEYEDHAVESGELYQYAIRANTLAGGNTSVAAVVRVPDGIPAGIDPPQV